MGTGDKRALGGHAKLVALKKRARPNTRTCAENALLGPVSVHALREKPLDTKIGAPWAFSKNLRIKNVEFVPVQVMEKWAKVLSHIASTPQAPDTPDALGRHSGGTAGRRRSSSAYRAAETTTGKCGTSRGASTPSLAGTTRPLSGGGWRSANEREKRGNRASPLGRIRSLP